MFDDKQKIIEILQELEWVWNLALGFKKLIILTSNKDLINLIYEIIIESIAQTKINIDYDKKILLQKKLNKNKLEENYSNDSENFLEKNINII